ncbi:MAG: single-stranded-DNA-specific exonuclease RecJ [Candidatus Omnitrophica bacterium]|nr:single-stranded-DNA-specific exonuclease RecJ [Candidatus Omnitrophota bacterium]
MQKHKILNIAHPDNKLKENFSKELGISGILAQILVNRGLKSIAEAERFLKADVGQLLDPYSFTDMPKAVGIIKKTGEQKDKVMIFGDYDADGITALALLKSTLQKQGINTEHYLPHRVKEGYGLNKDIVEIAKRRKIKTLITVDCGTNNHREIEGLRRNNIEVIVTDHHENSNHSLPPASSILNAKLKDSNYKYRDLAGVGVAYKLSQAISDSELLDDLDLVSLGTIADSAPLTGENRIIAKEGLARMPRTKKKGLEALIENAGIQNKKFTSTFISFIIGPRINASGRIDSAEDSLKLLMSKTQEEAQGYAKILEKHNRQRQKIESKILQEAEDLINKEVNFKEHKVIVVAKDDWHQGVLGIVASKLADRFLRPAIVISMSEDLCRGSARSIKNFHLFDALVDCKKFLNAFGGHSHAAGLVITRESIDDFKESINRLAHQRLTLEDLLPSIDVDMEVSLSDLNEEIVVQLELLEPFGAGNPAPIFYTKNLKLKSQPQTLSRGTLKFWVTDGVVIYQAIGFGLSSFKDSLMQAECFDLIFTPRIDSWRDESSLLLEIKDIFFK